MATYEPDILCRLNFDIFSAITSILNDDLDSDALKSCALVSRDLRSLCQPHLFSKISIASALVMQRFPEFKQPNTHALAEVLDKNPPLARLVSTFHLQISYGQFQDPFLCSILQRFHKIQNFSLTSDHLMYADDPALNWYCLEDGLRLGIQNIISTSELLSLSLGYTGAHIPLNHLLSGAPNLRYLKINRLRDPDLQIIPHVGWSHSLQLREVHLSGNVLDVMLPSRDISGSSGSFPLVGLAMLTKLTMVFNTLIAHASASKLLSGLSQLKSLKLKVYAILQFNMFKSLNTGSFKTLQEIEIYTQGIDNEELFGFACADLLSFPSDSILKKVTFTAFIWMEGRPGYTVSEDCWNALNFLASKTRFPCLEWVKVVITIGVFAEHAINPQLVYEALQRITEHSLGDVRQRLGEAFFSEADFDL